MLLWNVIWNILNTTVSLPALEKIDWNYIPPCHVFACLKMEGKIYYYDKEIKNLNYVQYKYKISTRNIYIHHVFQNILYLNSHSKFGTEICTEKRYKIWERKLILLIRCLILNVTLNILLQLILCQCFILMICVSHTMGIDEIA